MNHGKKNILRKVSFGRSNMNIKQKLQNWGILEIESKGNWFTGLEELSPDSWKTSIASDGSLVADKVIKSALAHYCEICDTGFKTRGSTTNHKRLKHKNLSTNTQTNVDTEASTNL